MDQQSTLTWAQKLSFGVGQSLNNLVASMWNSYFIMYMQLILAFHSSTSGNLMLIGQVANAVATPLFGYEMTHKQDHILCRKYGKRKLLHLIGTICVIFSTPFIFSVCPGCEYSSEYAIAFMLAPLIIIFQVGWAAAQVAHLSLIPVLSPYKQERDLLNALRYAVCIMSDMSAYVIVWCVFDLSDTPSGDHNTITTAYSSQFMLIIIILLTIGTSLSTIFHLGVKDNCAKTVPLDSCESRRTIEQKDSQYTKWFQWFKDVKFYQVGFLYMFARLYQTMNCVFIPLYLNEFLRAQADYIAIIPLIMNMSGFCVSCFMPKIYNVFSKKITFLGASFLGIAACLWLSIGHGYNFRTFHIYAVGLIIGISSAAQVVCAFSFIHDLIGTNSESGAFVYGCMSFWDKLANGVAIMVIQHLHWYNGVEYDTFYRNVLAYGVGCMAIGGSLTVLTLFSTNLDRTPENSKRFLLKFIPKPKNYDSTVMSSNEVESCTLKENT